MSAPRPPPVEATHRGPGAKCTSFPVSQVNRGLSRRDLTVQTRTACWFFRLNLLSTTQLSLEYLPSDSCSHSLLILTVSGFVETCISQGYVKTVSKAPFGKTHAPFTCAKNVVAQRFRKFNRVRVVISIGPLCFVTRLERRLFLAIMK